MAIFCYKKLETTQRSGERLRQAREERGLPLDYIADRTHIQKKYLTALEQNNFSALPSAKAYRLAYIKEYALRVGLNADELTQQFIAEGGIEDIEVTHPRSRLRILPFTTLSILARNLLFAGLILVFGGYLIWQVRGVLQPPKLVIYQPVEGYILNQSNITVMGDTEKETQLTVNGQDIMVNEAGHFETSIDLTPGVNTLVFTATKKHGKTTSITRHLVLEQRENADKISLK